MALNIIFINIILDKEFPNFTNSADSLSFEPSAANSFDVRTYICIIISVNFLYQFIELFLIFFNKNERCPFMLVNREINQNVSDFIGNYCSKWNLSVSRFAEKCGIPYMTVKRILSCDVQKIDIYTILCIARATRTPIMEILGDESENLELYKRISHISEYEKTILTNVLNIIEKLHVSGKECREIPCIDLLSDGISYLLDPDRLSGHRLNFDRTETISFRSSFAEGMSYFGFRLPDNRMSPLYLKGHILLIRNDDPEDGDIGAYAWKDEGRVRMVFRRVKEEDRYTKLLPLTGRGRTYSIDNDSVADLTHWVKLGVVTGTIR